MPLSSPRLCFDDVCLRALDKCQDFVALRLGDVITCVQRVVDVFEKQGKLGQMTFLVTETEGRDESGALVFTVRSTRLIH